MKNLNLFLPLFIGALVITSCTGNRELSDAYGNFEVDDVIISAEANGKLMQFNVEEGKELSEGKQVGLIDTISLDLKKKQLVAQKAAIASNMDNIQSQIAIQEQKKKNLLVDKNRVEKL